MEPDPDLTVTTAEDIKWIGGPQGVNLKDFKDLGTLSMVSIGMS